MTVSDKMKSDETAHYVRLIIPEIPRAPWVLRITKHKGKPVPVFIAKERLHPDQRSDTGERAARGRSFVKSVSSMGRRCSGFCR